MEQACVKWFNNAKGFGFVTCDSFDGDIFVHFSAIEGEGYRTLKMGQKVQIEFVDSDKGASVTKLIILPE
ncbi:Cold shock-like protein CspD [Bibersteinia trehalosi USDA-ARS-USMARC-188]|uniref:Cold shock-like protein CspD n=4 Tax=Bibersteinia trehalosi TaxID=47735 RepID=A0A4V7IAA0_BIBTR|nr:cold shock domain-containing protein [Bibersteinia trehalosi]AGH38256.1 Cold shock-like protein CspD [Bibersteinia trehalosi USDA-ARS-USMARC-192]AHG81944.1 Cold shock-like protein CspD [Bibersteinia trehalosi USDA-ARS-USMARC-188]AHG84244.1 Cold shock-like protein CspD [Bibersteinia trehalosi USDA-ARS-USMARC-189]OAQ15226.1 cold-shock protein [Bibersteinia trehalosi Y31]RRN02647.1 cold shock domain protein CspD [Bibersteinia trehalosi]